MSEIIKQRQWTPEALRAHGYHYYPRKKERVMAGRLPAHAAPLEIEYPYETVLAQAGDIICFAPDGQVKKRLYDYEHWSVKPDIFRVTYKKWDDPKWTPSQAEKDLMAHGCLPYYKHQGVWARRLTQPTLVLTLESTAPTMTPAGMWIAVGAKGEPWHMDNETFTERYEVSATVP